MLSFTDEIMNGLLESSLEPAQLTADGFKDVGKGPGSKAGKSINWLTFKDQRQAVRRPYDHLTSTATNAGSRQRPGNSPGAVTV